MNELITILTILFLPLIGGLVGFLLRGKRAWISTLLVGVAFLLALSLSLQLSDPVRYTWEWLPGFELAIYLDKIGALLIALVTLISTLVLLFSKEYMKDEPDIARYFAKLGFFIFSMIGLLLADHLILLFVFWELVGLASYLLIGFWYSKEGISQSARLAFMVNRVADAALLSGILIMYFQYDSLYLSELDEKINVLPSVLMAIGAFGKSAQLPFSGWLTKAMVGPTPVSALIHAATMVAAGVYLLFRVSPFLGQDALTMIAIVGTITAFYGGICALLQHDIKKVLAYSTISQLGYMVLGIGVGARDAAIFHLITHAFFKAGLFLGAASIIHWLHGMPHDPQDMRYMGGIKHTRPWTYRAFLLCALALAGVPLFSGFMSKEGIILAAWQYAEGVGSWAYLLPDLALLAALLTSFYVGRTILLVFWGNERVPLAQATEKESILFVFPLIILALFSLWIVYDWNPIAHHSRYLSPFLASGRMEESMLITFLSMLLVLCGLTLSYSFFRPGSRYTQEYSEVKNPITEPAKFMFNGGYLNAVYHLLGRIMDSVSQKIALIDKKLTDPFIHLISIGTVVVSKALSLTDRFVIDGPVNWSASFSSYLGKRLAGLSASNAQTQIGWLLVLVILILGWFMLF